MNLWERQKGQWLLTWETGRRIDGHRDRRRETFHGNKHAAEKRWREVQQQLETETATVQNKYTVEEWCTYWLTHIKSGDLKPRAVTRYASLIRLYVGPTIGTIPLDKLNPGHIQAALERWQVLPTAHGTKDTLSPRTLRYILTVLRSMLDDAVRWQLVPRNVAHLIRLPKASPSTTTWWSPDDASKFIAALTSERYWITWAMALLTGLQQGEILGLRWQDVDLAARALTVAQTRDSRLQSFGTPKTERGDDCDRCHIGSPAHHLSRGPRCRTHASRGRLCLM